MIHETAETTCGTTVELNEKRLMRVLLVDDDFGFLKVAKKCLETEDSFSVDAVSSAREAYDRMRKES